MQDEGVSGLRGDREAVYIATLGKSAKNGAPDQGLTGSESGW